MLLEMFIYFYMMMIPSEIEEQNAMQHINTKYMYWKSVCSGSLAKILSTKRFMQNDNINDNDNDDNDAHKSNLPRPTCCGIFHYHNL